MICPRCRSQLAEGAKFCSECGERLAAPSPAVGIDEDPVTGAAHAALVPFWAERLGRQRFTALQASKRTGLLDCELKGDRVILGGHAVTVIEGYFQV